MYLRGFFFWCDVDIFKLSLYLILYTLNFLVITLKKNHRTISKDILYIKSGNVATVLWHCALSVFALCKHCSGNSALVSLFSFFFFLNPFV